MANAAKVQVSGSHDGNAATAHVDTFARQHLPPRRALAGIHLHAAGAALSAATELRQLFPRPLGRAGTWRRSLRHQPRRQLHLSRAASAREPHRQCAGRQARSRHRRTRAAALGQQSDDGCDLSGGDQGRWHCRGDDAAVARQGAILSDPEGGDHARALRWKARRGNGEGESCGARSQARGLLGQRRGRLARGADRGCKPGVQGCRYCLRRRLPDRVHVGHDRRSQGHHAFPP